MLLPYGRNQPGGWCWQGIGLVSSRFISRAPAKICFSGPSSKAILIHPEIERRLSMAGLDCYLSLNYLPCPWTLVEGIEKLHPGHWLEWRDGKIRAEAYWRLPFPADRHTTMDAAKEELDVLLQQSVREHLISDVPLGVWLSGGLDSSTILHYASIASSSRLKTFSISFLGRSFDETEYAQQVARHYGTDHEQFDLNPSEDLAGTIEQFAYYNDEPTADAGALPLWFLSKLSKTRVTVTLSGEGGDEIFGGYITYRANQLAKFVRRLPASFLRFGLNTLRAWPVSDDKISLEYKAKRFLEGCLMSPARAHLYWNGTFSQQQKRDLVDSALPASFFRTHWGIAGTTDSRKRSVGIYVVRPEIFSARRHPHESRSHEHGARDRSEAAFSRSSYRGIRRLAARFVQDKGLTAKGAS